MPTWRADSQRSGATSTPLAKQLHLQWSRQLPAKRVAWPNETRLQFDASYEPVVMGQSMFVASSVDGSVRAFDTRSGEVKWTFFSEGPVRLAPAAWKDRLFFGSDDGYLYCLAADSGELLWKVRGAPADRPDYRQLGNTRLVSYWPVRGGPVVEDGTVYFGTGIWPTMGIFVHAVDAQSGKIRWTNSNTHYIENVRVDHNYLTEVGLSPQGYCLVANGQLVMPNGRSMPARFDLKTGDLQHYVQGYRNGDSRVTSSGSFLFVGERGVVSTQDGREVGNRWVEAGKDAPASWDSNKRDKFEGPFYGYKFLPACDHRSVFADGVALGVEKGLLYGYDLARPKTSLYEKKVGDLLIHPARWDLAPVWKPHFLTDAATQATRVSIKAGDRLYTHVGKKLLAVDIPAHNTANAKSKMAPSVAWTKQLEATPSSMLAADDKLLVVLDDHRILCFGADKMEAATMHAAPMQVLSDNSQQIAEQLLAATGVKEGHVVVLGLDEGELVESLLRESTLKVIAIDADQAKVNSLRNKWAQTGLYGTRVEAFAGDPATFNLPPYLANLVVSEIAGAESPLGKIDPKRLFSVLRPYGGTAAVPSEKPIEPRWLDADIEGATVEIQDKYVILSRASAASGAADWTHETGDAARTYFSTDQRVKAPLALLWYGDGPDHGFQKFKDYGRGVKPQVARGRLFAFDDRAKHLAAVDIYTGRLLWRHDTDTSIVRFVSLPDEIYVASGLKCEVLDPASGALKTSLTCDIKVDASSKPGVVAVRATEDLLLIGIGFDLPTGHSHPAIESGLWDAKTLVAFDRRTRQQLWTRTAKERFNLHAIAIGRDAVYCVDSIAPLDLDKRVRRGATAETIPSTTLALQARTGDLIWKKSFDYGYRAMTGRGPLAIRPYDDWVAYNAEHDLLLSGKLHEIRALRADTGEEAWISKSAGTQPIILSSDTYINQAGHRFDVTDGKRLSTSPLFRRTGGCNYTVGNQNLLFLRNKCATYVDMEKQKEHSLRNLRSGCSNSLVAAGGLLNVPCFSTGCVCNYPLQTSFSMYHLPESEAWSGEAPIALPKEPESK